MRTVAGLRPLGSVSHDPRGDLSRAWVAVVLIPVFLIVGFAVGEGLISALGYSVGDSTPLWVSLVSDVGALVTILVPCAAAVFFAQHARRAGVHRAVVPIVVAALLGGVAVLMTVITEIGNYV